MNPDSRIYVAGHRGMAGSAIVNALQRRGYSNLVTRTHTELDLGDQAAVRRFFAEEKIEGIYFAAARVGGILANNTYPAEFIHDNLAIQNNLIHEAWRADVRSILFLGSSCIYPRDCPQPIREEYLLTGPLEPTNRPYALAKIAGVEMCWSYNRQYGTRYVCAMPTNLYGPGDTYDLRNSHVLPALILKCHLAKVGDQPSITAWGSGKPRREFLHCDDMAEACVFMMQTICDDDPTIFNDLAPPLFNVGSGKDISISELVPLVAKIVGYRGDIVWDADKPDGTPQKLLSIDRLERLGWRQRIALADGIAAAYEDFLRRGAQA